MMSYLLYKKHASPRRRYGSGGQANADEPRAACAKPQWLSTVYCSRLSEKGGVVYEREGCRGAVIRQASRILAAVHHGITRLKLIGAGTIFCAQRGERDPWGTNILFPERGRGGGAEQKEGGGGEDFNMVPPQSREVLSLVRSTNRS